MKGHSNCYPELAEPHPSNPERAIIPIEGGRGVYSVRDLPPLSLSRTGWEHIGRLMGWLENGETNA